MYVATQRPAFSVTQRRGTNTALGAGAWTQIPFATNIIAGSGVTVLGGGANDHFELTTPGWWMMHVFIRSGPNGMLVNVHSNDTAAPGGLVHAYVTIPGNVANVVSCSLSPWIFSDGTQKVTVSVFTAVAQSLSTDAISNEPRVTFVRVHPDVI